MDSIVPKNNVLKNEGVFHCFRAVGHEPDYAVEMTRKKFWLESRSRFME